MNEKQLILLAFNHKAHKFRKKTKKFQEYELFRLEEFLLQI